MLFASAWLPHEIELPQIVQHNANGDVVILEVRNQVDQTVQVVFENNEDGDLTVHLRGWGNKPARLGNMDRTSFSATIPLEPDKTCEVCYGKLGECSCEETLND